MKVSDTLERKSLSDLLLNGDKNIVEELIRKHVPIKSILLIIFFGFTVENCEKYIPGNIKARIIAEYNEIIKDKGLELVISVL